MRGGKCRSELYPNRFTQADTIVPTSTQGTQAWDRYAFVNNNPVRYTDPTGHRCVAADGEDDGCLNDDGTTGAGFTGVASASSGKSSNVSKGCGGYYSINCDGNENSKKQKMTESEKIGLGFTVAMTELGMVIPIEARLLVLTVKVGAACILGDVLACIAEIPVAAADIVVADFGVSLMVQAAKSIETGYKEEFEWQITPKLYNWVLSIFE